MAQGKRRWLVSGVVAGVLLVGTAGAAFAATTGVGSGMMGGGTPAAATGGMLGPEPGTMIGGPGAGGMMGGAGLGTMMGGRGNGGMMGGFSGATAASPVTTLSQAQQRVEQYLQQLGNGALKVGEVMQFQDNFYAIVKDTSTGHGAFELLVQKSTGVVSLEYGPAMMWNTEYGRAGRMMGTQRAGAAMSVSTTQARQIAQTWLDAQQPGSTTEAPDQFPGYYTLHILKGGKVTGMLSVNGYSGQVWYHTWHGAFIGMKDLGA